MAYGWLGPATDCEEEEARAYERDEEELRDLEAVGDCSGRVGMVFKGEERDAGGSTSSKGFDVSTLTPLVLGSVLEL